MAASEGGYFPETWAWVSALTLVAAAALLISGAGAVLYRLDLAFLGMLVAFVGWTLLSAFWSPSVTSSVFQAQRLLAYLGVILLALLVVTRATTPQFVGGCLGGVALVSGYALLTRLLPGRLSAFDTISGYRLSDPIGYWNGLGVYAAMGALLAVGLIARAERTVARAASGALPVALVTTLYFTYSRGSWIALAMGFLVAVAVDPTRLRLLIAALAVAPWCAAAVWLASRADALTTQGADFAVARSQGHTLMLELAGLTVGACATCVALALFDRNYAVPAGARRAFSAALVVAALGGLGVVWAAKGSPVSLAESAWTQFNRSPQPAPADLNSRLFDLSSNGRVEQWRVAWDDFTSRPVAGRGAGSFAASWAEERPIPLTVKNAHSLYLETLAELGVVGLALLSCFLLLPVLAARSARRAVVFPGAVAAFSAYLVHVAGDWDWQLTGVTVVALVAAVGLLVSARGEMADRAPASAQRVLLPLAAAGAVLALVSVLGNVPLGRSRDALDAGNFAAAASSARTAERWAPWSTEALRMLGEARLGQGDLAGAREKFAVAVERDPTSWELWLDLALASTGAERRAALARAHALNPLSAQVAQLRGS